MPMNRSHPARPVIYWIATALSALLFAAPGIALVIHDPHFAAQMTFLGYPAYFMTLLGIWKIAGAAAIVAPGLPRLKEWAYAGMMFDIVGAFVSRAVKGSHGPELYLPILIGLIVATSWALRPAGRTLISSPSRTNGDIKVGNALSGEV